MSSNLEKFVNRNRSEFDTEHPSADVWSKIEKTLPLKKEAKVFSLKDIYKFSAAAAVVCIVLTSVYFLYIRQQKNELTARTETKTNASELNGIAPEYVAEAKQVFNAIETRQEELKEATADNPELYKQFLDDLQLLDSTYNMLQKQAAHTANKDVIMKAMLQNLQLQAELLYRQLLITNDIKKQTKQNNGLPNG
jgi:predicted nuclease with TOPRIM domain